jgi:hypothetical protein
VNHTEPEPRRGDAIQEGTEFWPLILGYRLKITDTLIALFTALLFGATWGLWVATKNLVAGAQRTARTQLRAFVFGKFESAPNVGDAGTITQYIFYVPFENVGLTPATHVRSWLKVHGRPKGENVDPTFVVDEVSPPTVMGPRTVLQSSLIAIPLPAMMACWRQETEIFVWSRIEYRDIFDPDILHHHEQCGNVVLLRQPDIVPAPNSPPHVAIAFTGPQNTTD